VCDLRDGVRGEILGNLAHDSRGGLLVELGADGAQNLRWRNQDQVMKPVLVSHPIERSADLGSEAILREL